MQQQITCKHWYCIYVSRYIQAVAEKSSCSLHVHQGSCSNGPIFKTQLRAAQHLDDKRGGDMRICAATIRIWQYGILCHHALYPGGFEDLRICAATIRIWQYGILCHHALHISLGLRIWRSVQPPSGSENIWFCATISGFEDLRICAVTIRIWQHVILCHHALYPWVDDTMICAAAIRIWQYVVQCYRALYPCVLVYGDMFRHHPNMIICCSVPPCTISLGWQHDDLCRHHPDLILFFAWSTDRCLQPSCCLELNMCALVAAHILIAGQR